MAGWTIPDKGSPLNDIQAITFSTDLDVLTAGITGIDCVVFGCAVTGNANLVPSVAKGGVMTNGVLKAVTAATVTIGTADASNPRIDLIVIDSTGAKQVRAGTAAANPKPPARTANDVVLAFAYVPAAATSLATGNFIDKRMVRDRGLAIAKTTSPVTHNTDLAIFQYFGVTLPSGLMLAGRQVHVKCGGDYLLNSGTPTLILTLAYGGTTFFADVSTAAVSGANRGAWYLDFVLNSSAQAVQTITGQLSLSDTNGNTSKVAPTTGTAGDLLDVPTAYTNSPVNTPLRGASTVDSDAADRLLAVSWTMSVSNALDEIVMDFAYAELM